MSFKSLVSIGMLVAAIFVASPVFAQSNTTPDSVKITWKVPVTLKLFITPNYAAGYGPVFNGFGAKPTPLPAVGPGAAPGAGSVDFGSVEQGFAYLYKFAAHVQIVSNGPFNLYGEGSADFTGSGAAAGSTMTITSTLYWLNSVPSGTDTNTSFSSSTPFQRTTQAGAAYNNPVITYTTYPSPIAVSTGNHDFYYDYQMRVPLSATTGPYSVYVVYTGIMQ